MNATMTTKYQKAFNYAMYMMLGSYFRRATVTSHCALKTMYLYYAELGNEKQYAMEDIVIKFTENILRKELPEDIWEGEVKIFFRQEEQNTYVAFVGDKYTLVVENHYKGKTTKLKYRVWRSVSSINR